MLCSLSCIISFSYVPGEHAVHIYHSYGQPVILNCILPMVATVPNMSHKIKQNKTTEQNIPHNYKNISDFIIQ